MDKTIKETHVDTEKFEYLYFGFFKEVKSLFLGDWRLISRGSLTFDGANSFDAYVLTFIHSDTAEVANVVFRVYDESTRVICANADLVEEFEPALNQI